jgi:1-acyl-sn-glycerol-3-phosphate acyltransferase
MRAETVETRLPAPAAVAGFVRLLTLGLHLTWGLAIATLVFPLAPLATRLALRARWARNMLEGIGVELRIEGAPLASGALVLANHISWLDVLVIASLTPAMFVAKSEVRRWPAIGWLAARAETLFLRRASGRSLLAVKNRIAGLLVEGRSVALFPEATTTEGETVLPFRSGMLQAAVDGDRPVQAIALAYRDEHGGRSAAAAFVDGTSLWSSILAICAAGRVTVCVAIAAPLAPAGRTRKTLARQARGAVAAMLAARN